MAEATAAGQGPETIPNDLIIAELQHALHNATLEIVVLRARIALRDRQAAALAPAPVIEQNPGASS